MLRAVRGEPTARKQPKAREKTARWYSGRRRRKIANGMQLSVVVVVHDMPNTARRTLRALAADYQRGIGAADYEVIVVDNGSMPRFDDRCLEELAGTFHCLRMAAPSPSPGPAVNYGVAAARGDVIGLIPDGSRIATPRLLSMALRAVTSHPRAAATTVGWLLGRAAPEQAIASDDASTAAATDALLAAVDWPADPYRLFEASRLDGSTHWFGPGTESTAVFLRRSVWDELGGMDERFTEPGGGFVCLDFYARLLALPDVEMMMLLGEGTVHQPHGGVSTDIPPPSLRPHVEAWLARYRDITGHDLPLSTPDLTYFGRMPEPWRAQLAVWTQRELLEEFPALGAARARLESRLATCPRERTLMDDLHAFRDLLVDADAAVSAARQEADAARAESAAAHAAVARLLASRSWRLSAPFRWAARVINPGRWLQELRSRLSLGDTEQCPRGRLDRDNADRG
jgi:glycosyltransferase involved in cell wall biosynthesis